MSEYDDAELTIKQKEKFVEWLNKFQNGTDFTCTVCGKNDWEFIPHLVSVPAFSARISLKESFNYPNVMLLCTTCSHTVLFNAVVSGIVTVKDGALVENEEVDEHVD